MLAIVVPPICHYFKRLYLENLLGWKGHGAQLPQVCCLVGHFVIHDQLVLGIHAHLHIVSYLSAPALAHRHGAGIWICERDLPLSALFKLLLQGFMLFPVLLQCRDLLPQFFRRWFVDVRFVLIVLIQPLQIALDLLINALYPALQLAPGKVFTQSRELFGGSFAGPLQPCFALLCHGGAPSPRPAR
jgi:hypothetical protein